MRRPSGNWAIQEDSRRLLLQEGEAMADPRISPLPQSLTAGEKLRRRRQDLGLTMREIHLASLKIGAAQDSAEFIVSIGRLSDIETKCVVPNIYRVHSLARIYRMELSEILAWYGVGP
jgi:hypothetical protein